MSHLEKLNKLQTELGYAGAVHPVALLGLFGEAGEVAAESDFDFKRKDGGNGNAPQYTLFQALEVFIDISGILDREKKHIRKMGPESFWSVSVAAKDEEKFTDELADVFYYLNAIALGCGITLDELAALSLAKVARKRAGGMPAELLTTTHHANTPPTPNADSGDVTHGATGTPEHTDPGA